MPHITREVSDIRDFNQDKYYEHTCLVPERCEHQLENTYS